MFVRPFMDIHRMSQGRPSAREVVGGFYIRYTFHPGIGGIYYRPLLLLIVCVTMQIENGG